MAPSAKRPRGVTQGVGSRKEDPIGRTYAVFVQTLSADELMINEDLQGPKRTTPSIDYCLIFAEAGGRALSFASTNEPESDKTIEKSVLCFAGSARFTLTG
jgi:hypothetical protein